MLPLFSCLGQLIRNFRPDFASNLLEASENTLDKIPVFPFNAEQFD